MIAERKKEDTGDDIDLLLFFVSDEDLSRRDREEEKERKEEGKAKSTKVSNRNGERLNNLHREHRSSVSDFHRGFTKRVERSQKARRNAQKLADRGHQHQEFTVHREFPEVSFFHLRNIILRPNSGSSPRRWEQRKNGGTRGTR